MSTPCQVAATDETIGNLAGIDFERARLDRQRHICATLDTETLSPAGAAALVGVATATALLSRAGGRTGSIGGHRGGRGGGRRCLGDVHGRYIVKCGKKLRIISQLFSIACLFGCAVLVLPRFDAHPQTAYNGYFHHAAEKAHP